MIRALTIVALPGLLLTFALSASAITDAELDAIKREVEYAKAKADIAEQQVRGAKANPERMKLEKDFPKTGAVPASPPPADPKAAATAAKPTADAKKGATK